MKTVVSIVLSAFLLAIPLSGQALLNKKSPEERRQKLQDQRNSLTGKDTYMKMFSAGGGIGMGVKDFIIVFVFHTEDAMDKFQQSGWDFSGQADANAQTSTQGEGAETAGSVMPGTSIYQLTKSGLALQATLQGTKFWVDKDLN